MLLGCMLPALHSDSRGVSLNLRKLCYIKCSFLHTYIWHTIFSRRAADASNGQGTLENIMKEVDPLIRGRKTI